MSIRDFNAWVPFFYPQPNNQPWNPEFKQYDFSGCLVMGHTCACTYTLKGKHVCSFCNLNCHRDRVLSNTPKSLNLYFSFASFCYPFNSLYSYLLHFRCVISKSFLLQLDLSSGVLMPWLCAYIVPFTLFIFPQIVLIFPHENFLFFPFCSLNV